MKTGAFECKKMRGVEIPRFRVKQQVRALEATPASPCATSGGDRVREITVCDGGKEDTQRPEKALGPRYGVSRAEGVWMSILLEADATLLAPPYLARDPLAVAATASHLLP